MGRRKLGEVEQRMPFRYWRLENYRGVDLLKADASAHRYARHSHEGYAIGVVESGAHAFTARGEVWTAVPGRIVMVNPDDAHDGGPARRDDRYSYRMIYVDESVMSATLVEAVGGPTAVPFFPSAVVNDAALAQRLRRSTAASNIRIRPSRARRG